ncbi:F-box associated domain containing protein [Tanacetum coccineum]
MEEEMTLEIGPAFPPEIFEKSLLENPLQQPQPDEVRILGSCNGLLCIVEEWKSTLFIYNPTTRRSNLLPSPQLTSSFGLFYGFGYDELSNDYKVVITETESKMATRIYSLNNRRWKEIGNFPWAGPFDDGKLLNGALHWAAGEDMLAGLWKIVSLDLANETYGEVLQPMYHEGYDYLELGLSGEWLCVLGDYAGYYVVTVWVMKVYGVKDSWTHLANIPYPPTWTVQVRAPFCISEDGKLMLKFGQNLVVYDSKDNSSSVIDNFIVCLEACTVVESLVSPFSPLGLAGNNDDED